jgi:hypothetical protein
MAESAGRKPLIANRTAAGPSERFQLLTNHDGSNSLRALITGKYVTADHAGAGPLIANRTRIGPWERFKLVTIQIPGRSSAQELISSPYSGQR